MKKVLTNILTFLATAAAIYGLIIGAIFLSMALGNEVAPQKGPLGQCPKTKVVGVADACFKCHVPVTFKLKEVDPCEGLILPSASVRARCSDSKVDELTWYMTRIDSNDAEEVLGWALQRKLKKIVIESQSPGGSLFEAWRIVGLMKTTESAGIIIETRCYGFAASAGFLILASGTKGYRYASPTAHLMWHELMSLSLFKIETPSSSEETSKTLRKLQDIANSWLSQVSKMSKQEIDQMVKNKDFWMTGEEAFERGFIDYLLK